MDKSEIRFKYNANNLDINTIPDAIDRGEFYVNTASSYMYLKTSDDIDEGLLFPGTLYSDDKDNNTNYNIIKEDCFDKANAKRYLVYRPLLSNTHKYPIFAFNECHTIYVAHTRLAEIKDNAIKVEVDNDYLDTVYDIMNSDNHTTVLGIMGYTDDEYKDKNEWGTSSITMLDSIDDDGYAHIKTMLGGYMLMKDIPSPNDIINYGVNGMSWHVYNDNVTLEDGTHMYGTARLLRPSSSTYILEIYTPYASICDKATLYINADNNDILTICNTGAYHNTKCHIHIKDGDKLTVNEALDFALSYFPMTSQKNAVYKDGKKVYPAIPSNNELTLNIKRTDLCNEMVNCLMNAGINNIYNTALDVNRIIDNTFMQASIRILGGLESTINTSNTTFPIYVVDNEDFSYVPISFIHGTLYGDEGLSDNWNITFDDINSKLSNMDSSSTFYHISNIYVCNRFTMLGGDEDEETSYAVYDNEPSFVSIDYQEMSLDKSGRGENSVSCRKYIRIENGRGVAVFEAPQCNINININE